MPLARAHPHPIPASISGCFDSQLASTTLSPLPTTFNFSIFCHIRLVDTHPSSTSRRIAAKLYLGLETADLALPGRSPERLRRNPFAEWEGTQSST
jgi:hypothetical protein